MQKANHIADLIIEFDPGIKLVMVALNKGSGRFAQSLSKARVSKHVC